MTPAPRPPASVDARVAKAADVDALASLYARAFHDDPVWGWAFADPDRRLEQQGRIWRFALESALDYGWVWVTAGCAAAALWIPPGKPELRPEDEERFGPLLEEVLGARSARVVETFARFDRAHPEDRPHYYLSLLASDPDQRGRGLGMGLLAANLARLDGEGAAAFLESSNPANDARYERLGFAPCGEFELSEDGPNVTQMWRDPR